MVNPALVVVRAAAAAGCRCSSVMMLMLAQVSIAWRSMNDGDVYILDVGEIFYVWNGRQSSRTERIKVRRSNDAAAARIFVAVLCLFCSMDD